MADDLTLRHRAQMHLVVAGVAHAQLDTRPDDEDEQPESVLLDRALFDAMGQPDVVTVTVEPFDLLNDVAEAYVPLLGTATVDQLLDEVAERLADAGTSVELIATVEHVRAELPAEVLALRGDLP